MGQELSTAKAPRKSSRASGRALPKSKPLPEPTALPAPSRRSPKRQARGRKRVTIKQELAQLDDKRGFEHVKPRKRLPSYALGRIVDPPTATGGYEGSDTEDDDLYYSSSGHSTALSSVRSVIATGAANAPITLW